MRHAVFSVTYDLGQKKKVGHVPLKSA